MGKHMLKHIFIALYSFFYFLSVNLSATNLTDATATPTDATPKDQFLKACLDGQQTVITNYVEVQLEDPYVVDDHGRTGLVYAIWGGHVEVVEYLMRVASGINLKTTANNTSAVQIAVSRGNPNIVRAILALPPKIFEYDFIKNKDYDLIKNRLLALVRGTENALLPPKEIAKQNGHKKILNLLNEFDEQNSSFSAAPLH
jgi:ankyrin repeat protein